VNRELSSEQTDTRTDTQTHARGDHNTSSSSIQKRAGNYENIYTIRMGHESSFQDLTQPNATRSTA